MPIDRLGAGEARDARVDVRLVQVGDAIRRRHSATSFGVETVALSIE
jgi:hypothetical protein